MPLRIEQKERTIQDFFYPKEVSTLQAFEQVVCSTGTELPYKQAPESGDNYKDVLMPSKPDPIQDIPSIKPSESQSLGFKMAEPSNDDEKLRLQIILNRHYLYYLNAQFGLINLEYNNVINRSKENPYLLSTIYTSTETPRFSEDGAKDRVTSFLAKLPTSAEDYRFSIDKLKLDVYPTS